MKAPVVICGVIELLSALANILMIQRNEFYWSSFQKIAYGAHALDTAGTLNLFGIWDSFCKNSLVFNAAIQFILGVYLLTSLTLKKMGEHRHPHVVPNEKSAPLSA